MLTKIQLFPHNLQYSGSLFDKIKSDATIDAQEDDEESLNGMHDEHEVEGLIACYAIEDKHRLHGKMPGAGTIGCRYDDSHGPNDEGHQGTSRTKVGGSGKTKEGEIIMQEVAHPDANGEEDEERHVLHIAHGDDARPQSDKGIFHLIIYRQLLNDEPQQYNDSDATDSCHPQSCRGEMGEYLVNASTRAREEVVKNGKLP